MPAFQFLRRILTPGRPERAVMVSAALGATAFAASALGRSASRRSARRTGLVVAGASLVATLANDLPAFLEARRTAAETHARSPQESAQNLADLPEGARALIAGMLDYSADPGSATLRSQLSDAHGQLSRGRSAAHAAIEIDLPNGAALPRVVPHRQRFPVVASFQDPDSGEMRTVRLEISDGQLSQLNIRAGAPMSGAQGSAPGRRWRTQSRALWPARWPALADVQFAIESDEPADTRAARWTQAMLRK